MYACYRFNSECCVHYGCVRCPGREQEACLLTPALRILRCPSACRLDCEPFCQPILRLQALWDLPVRKLPSARPVGAATIPTGFLLTKYRGGSIEKAGAPPGGRPQNNSAVGLLWDRRFPLRGSQVCGVSWEDLMKSHQEQRHPGKIK